MQCSLCEHRSSLLTFAVHLSTVLFVELSQGALAAVSLSEQIEVDGNSYILYSVISNIGAVRISQHWELFNDMKENVLKYDSLANLFVNNSTGWFFAVYILRDSPECNLFSNVYGMEHSEADIANRLTQISQDHCYTKLLNSIDHNYARPLKRKVFNQQDYMYTKQINTSSESKTIHADTTKQQKLDKNLPVTKNVKVGDYTTGENNGDDRRNCTAKRRTINITGSVDMQKQLHTQDPVINELRTFHSNMNMTIKQCCICFEAWPIKSKSKAQSNTQERSYMCVRCKSDKKVPKKFSAQNNMIPSVVPKELTGLSQCEEMLISRAFPVMQVYVKPGLGYFGYKGHTITLPHNVQHIANTLSNLPVDLPLVSFYVKGRSGQHFDFKVRREVVLAAL